ncbi:MAG TPA: hypothetical protein DHV62_08255 [Elusimicrobia bacterium]|nr:hypothetical protein [Elusimicrobiota bacterium]
MKRFNWQILLGLSLVVLSAFLYFVHYLIFRDTHHIFIYLLGDLAFIPVEVLVVTLILHRLLTEREKRAMLEKLNMVVGAFFSEVGTRLLKSFSNFDPDVERIRKDLVVSKDWTEQEFRSLSQHLKNYEYIIESKKGNLEDLKSLLVGKRNFLLRLLENPNLLEHDTFTNLLWAVFHLTEELEYRIDLKQLPDSDYEHLANDMKRAYTLLISEWLVYMKHLQESYPYLFSLAMRTNPFDLNASIEVK